MNTADDVVFEARAIEKRFGGVLATDKLSLDLRRGEIHALIGPNGAGKTTALAQFCGELRPDAGAIHHHGEDITRLGLPERARRGIARSFQITAIFEEFTVLENVMLAVQARATSHFRFLRPAHGDRTLVEPGEALLAKVGLDGEADRPAHALAHGKKRQLEIAMTLATRPEILLLDEPMAGMGAAEAEHITRLLERLRGNYTILLVEHDMGVVFRLADRVSVLVNGALIESGDPATVRRSPAVQAAYLEAPA